METYDNIKDLHDRMVGGYRSKKFKAHAFAYRWNQSLCDETIGINPIRGQKRINSYVSDDELDRVIPRLDLGKDVSIRMGVRKDGQGNFGLRGDFCLLGCSISGKTLTMHYRSLELFGGLVYDQAIINYLQTYLDLSFRTVVNLCASCHSFALKGNSNEKLYARLQKIYQRY